MRSTRLWKSLRGAVAAVEKVRADLKKMPKNDDPAAQGLIDELRKEEYRLMVSEGGHYDFTNGLLLTTP